MARVAGWAYMSPSIAGATTTGAEVARQVAVTTSPARPAAIAPSQCAVAGATRIASAESAATMWPIRPSGRRLEHVVLDRVAGQRGEGQRRDEPGRRRREQGDDLGALGLEGADELGRLVRRDRAGDAQGDQAARRGARRGPCRRWRGHPRPSSIGSPPATSAWRIARPRRVRSGSTASMPSRPAIQGACERPPVRIALTSRGAMPVVAASSARIRARSPAVRAW